MYKFIALALLCNHSTILLHCHESVNSLEIGCKRKNKIKIQLKLF